MAPAKPQNDRAPSPRLGRQPVEDKVFGARIISMPLPGDVAINHLGHATEIVALGSQLLGASFSAFKSGELKLDGAEDLNTEAMIKLLGTVAPRDARRLIELITELAPVLVGSTTVVAGGVKYELGNDEHRLSLLDERPDLYLPCAIFAGRVTYQRFFPASVLSDVATRAQSDSKDSSPST